MAPFNQIISMLLYLTWEKNGIIVSFQVYIEQFKADCYCEGLGYDLGATSFQFSISSRLITAENRQTADG